MAAAIHPAVAPLSYLLGTWRGQGQGCYPTISTFSYTEELHFSHSNPLKPVIAYSQKTWRSPAGPAPQPMHAESGFWRLKPDGSVEVVIAQSTGLVEVQKGSHDVEAKVIRLQSELVGNASKVKEISREFRLVNGELCYAVHMATTVSSLQTHLEAVLKKEDFRRLLSNQQSKTSSRVVVSQSKKAHISKQLQCIH